MGKFCSESRSRRASSRSQHERLISSHLFACNTSVLPDTHLQPSRFRRRQAENIPQHEESVSRKPAASECIAKLRISYCQFRLVIRAFKSNVFQPSTCFLAKHLRIHVSRSTFLFFYFFLSFCCFAALFRELYIPFHLIIYDHPTIKAAATLLPWQQVVDTAVACRGTGKRRRRARANGRARAHLSPCARRATLAHLAEQPLGVLKSLWIPPVKDNDSKARR